MRTSISAGIGTGKKLFAKGGPCDLLSCMLLVATVAALLLHTFHFNHTCDDAYISFRYARNFSEGHGLVFNVGERPVEGYTNFLWVMLLTPFLKVGFNPVTVARICGALFATGTMLLLFLLPRLWRRPSISHLVSPMFLASNGGYALWILGGLETHLFTFLLLLSVSLYLLERKRGWLPLSSLSFLLLSLTRPEGVLFFSLTLVHRLLTLKGGRTTFGREVFWVVSFALPYLAYFGWRLQYFGYPFPNTYYAKVQAGPEQFQRGLKYMLEFLMTYGGFLWVFPLFLFLKKVGPELKYLFMPLLTWLLYLIYVGGDSLVYYRLFVPIMPIAYLLTQEGLWVLLRPLDGEAEVPFPPGHLRRGVIGTIVVALALLITYRPSVYGGNWQYQLRDNLRVRTWQVLGKALKERLPKDTVIAMNYVGIVPFYSELKTIDRLGITDEHIAHSQAERLGTGIAGHEKTDSDYVLSRKPHIILIAMGVPLNHPMPWDDLKSLLERGGRPSDLDLLGHPRLWEMYKYGTIRVSENLFVPCLVQKEWGHLLEYE